MKWVAKKVFIYESMKSVYLRRRCGFFILLDNTVQLFSIFSMKLMKHIYHVFSTSAKCTSIKQHRNKTWAVILIYPANYGPQERGRG